jgi:hypothetical protein
MAISTTLATEARGESDAQTRRFLQSNPLALQDRTNGWMFPEVAHILRSLVQDDAWVLRVLPIDRILGGKTLAPRSVTHKCTFPRDRRVHGNLIPWTAPKDRG